MVEGIAAYASQQANLQEVLASSFRMLWKTPLHQLEESMDADEKNDNDDPDNLYDDLDCDSDDDGDDCDTGEGENGMHAQDSDGEEY